jgi:hypothetical protein
MRPIAPYTIEQVANIQEYQDMLHPFTCGSAHEGKSPVLLISQHGFKCPECDYTQFWCHDFMANGSAVKGIKDTYEQLRKQFPKAI